MPWSVTSLALSDDLPRLVPTCQAQMPQSENYFQGEKARSPAAAAALGLAADSAVPVSVG